MPITTPESLVSTYHGDKEHFLHVLEELFIPAVDAAGLNPIRPISKGSEVIHGDIIKNIETADLLLCDMSILNANVFFELGMRTATNKPVALVKDDKTLDVPFDLNIINHHTYSHELRVWEIKEQIKALKIHLDQCAENIEGGNALWQYFSVSAKAIPLESEPNTEGQLALVNRQLEDIRKELREKENEHEEYSNEHYQDIAERVAKRIFLMSSEYNVDIISLFVTGKSIRADAKTGPSPMVRKTFLERARKMASQYEVDVEINWREEDES